MIASANLAWGRSHDAVARPVVPAGEALYPYRRKANGVPIAVHCDTAIVPTRLCKPRDKAKMERTVGRMVAFVGMGGGFHRNAQSGVNGRIIRHIIAICTNLTMRNVHS